MLICGGIGGGAKNVLAEAAGIELVSGVSGKIEAAVEGYLAGRIHDNPEAEAIHHEHHHDEGGKFAVAAADIPATNFYLLE